MRLGIVVLLAGCAGAADVEPIEDYDPIAEGDFFGVWWQADPWDEVPSVLRNYSNDDTGLHFSVTTVDVDACFYFVPNLGAQNGVHSEPRNVWVYPRDAESMRPMWHEPVRNEHMRWLHTWSDEPENWFDWVNVAGSDHLHLELLSDHWRVTSSSEIWAFDATPCSDDLPLPE